MRGQIYTAGDGLVKGQGTPQASSSCGIAIRGPGFEHSQGLALRIRRGDESSYRAELEAIIGAYTIIPADIKCRHATDNLAVVDIHHQLCNYPFTPTRRWLRKPYANTLKRLSEAIRIRKTKLDIIHTLSHLEHVQDMDDDTNERRTVLAVADHAADLAHNTQAKAIPLATTMAFPLMSKEGLIIEQNIPKTIAEIQHHKWETTLAEKKRSIIYKKHTTTINRAMAEIPQSLGHQTPLRHSPHSSNETQEGGYAPGWHNNFPTMSGMRERGGESTSFYTRLYER